MHKASALIALAVTTLALAGCASSGSGSLGGPPPPTLAGGSPSAAAGQPSSAAGSPSSAAGSPSSAAGSPSSAAGEPSSAAGSPSAASGSCFTHSCIVSELEASLVGLVAKDGSVLTKATCYKSSVKHNAGNTYTASCDVTYSDNTVYAGFATLLVDSSQVSWEPTEQLQ